jgi:hypothetical protein
MEPLDGNAVAGALHDWFGEEMTTRRGICRGCRSTTLLAELRLYTRAPGAVARCPSCGSVVFVAVETGTGTRMHLEGIELD